MASIPKGLTGCKAAFVAYEHLEAGRGSTASGVQRHANMALIAQIALGVIIGGLTIALLVMGFIVWNGRQRNDRLALRLFIAGAVIVVVLAIVVVASQ